ncbi:extracellular sulfatase SULF-1 homolog [Planococcus citri]|uniref:extracellular sulfatase SULF-1 homolog n=1 Tax=Planococcus citri TaxID=170843 RepID=UPI0031F93A09
MWTIQRAQQYRAFCEPEKSKSKKDLQTKPQLSSHVATSTRTMMTSTSTVLKMCLLYAMAIDLVTCSNRDSSDRSAAADRIASVSRLQWKSSQQRHSTRSQQHSHTKNTRSDHARYTQNASEMPSASAPSSSSTSSKNRRPNIVLILTDDQDVELGSLNFMAETTRLLRNGGAELKHAYTTTPMCCPSRSSMLTGLYVHNHNVYTNNDNCSNIQWQIEHETRSFGAYLHNSGYYTGYFGKYLNKYNGSYTPPGWKEWGGLIMNSKYYNYSINLNGKRIRHGDDYYKDYYPDLIANDSVNFLRQWKVWNSNKPSLLVMSFPAPHGPEDSAPQYSDMFFNVTTHHTPSYDYAPNPDKQWILQVTGRMMPIHKQFTNLLMTKRLQTLQSVDSAVKKVYDTLKEIGELDNTYIIYTSDHGYHLGQFGLVKGKSFPFEFDVRVPFLVRGPGIEPGSIINEIALNIDLAPTILDLAGIPVPGHMDGRSLMKLFHRRKKSNRKYLNNWPDTFLIESSGRREIPITLAPHSDSSKNLTFSELSNVTENSIPSTEETVAALKSSSTTEKLLMFPEDLAESSFLQEFSNENLSSKRDNVDNVLMTNMALTNKAERLSMECQRPEYSSPCKIGQKWHCVLHDNRWRKHKCRYYESDIPALPNLQKCTCITEEGIVYMKFQTSDENQNQRTATNNQIQPVVVHYVQSNKTSDELVDELAKTWRIMKRHRRQAAETGLESALNSQMTLVMDVLHGQLMELQTSRNNHTNTACVVATNGSVSCSREIYDDPTLWETSQQNIVSQINKLQDQLDKLKDIQRHLDAKQPSLKILRNEIKLKSSSTDNLSLTLLTDSVLENVTTESSRTTADWDGTTKHHKHRHQHSTEMYKNLSSSRTKLHSVPEEVDKHLAFNSIPDTCYCVPHSSDDPLSTKEIIKEQKRRMKEQRIKKKERKLKRRAKLEKECYLEKMNCFNHDNDHWRTAPYWTEGPFCFCMNANNNTYSCLRTINSTHNFLYCEFVTGLVTFYNLRIDPFQQYNRISSLNIKEKSWLKDTLAEMMRCKGSQDCANVGGYKLSSNFEEFVSSRKKYSFSERKGRRKNTTAVEVTELDRES